MKNTIREEYERAEKNMNEAASADKCLVAIPWHMQPDVMLDAELVQEIDVIQLTQIGST